MSMGKVNITRSGGMGYGGTAGETV
jgi:hypothetical protein